MNKCIFLDRDGVLNEERGDYTFEPEDFKIVKGVPEAIKMIKDAGYLAIVITNQAGISKGLYTREQMHICHNILIKETGNLIDHIYYCPYHPVITNSLCRKPDSLMFEKAIAKFNIDRGSSWMVGDREGDIIAGKKAGVRTVLISEEKAQNTNPDFYSKNLLEAVKKILFE